MSAAEPLIRLPRMSYAEYLAFEETSEQKHEFHDGEVLAMSGGTYRHARATTNANFAVQRRLGDGPCFLLDANMRIKIQVRNRGVYPDGLIVCGEPEFDPHDPKQTTLINPTLVLETLSDSTESYDRGDKFAAYREIPSLREYVLISQDEPRIESFFREDDGRWLFSAWTGLEVVAELQSVGVSLPLAEVYRGIEPETEPEALGEG